MQNMQNMQKMFFPTYARTKRKYMYFYLCACREGWNDVLHALHVLHMVTANERSLMPQGDYYDERANRQADTLHERTYPGDIAALHTVGPPYQDTPESSRACACVRCNTARRCRGVPERRWHRRRPPEHERRR